MQTNEHGVRYSLKQTGDNYSVVVVGVFASIELPGFATRKCALAFAASLKPIVNQKLRQQDLKMLSEIACLEEDENGDFIQSNWPTVKNFEQLKNHINNSTKSTTEFIGAKKC